MQVLKFGGSSVANATNISRVIDIVSKAARRDRVALVCSAISGCTDALLDIARSERGSAERQVMLDSLRTRHEDIIRRLFTGAEREEISIKLTDLFDKLAAAPEDEMVTYGELFSTTIIAAKLRCEGFRTKWLDSRILVIKDNPTLTYNNISTAVALEPEVEIFVAPGFIASEYEGKVTTLGRGGSDFSAALYAAALKASNLEIWTDVPGIMTANPKLVPAARTIPEMPYQAALDMATHGAKVLYAPTVQPAMEASIAIRILNTFEPENPGTVVCSLPEPEVAEWMGVASTDDTLAGESLICLVSNGRINGEAACARMEDSLKKAGIKTLGCSSDGTNVYVSVRLAVAREALNAIHREFFESAPLSTLNLYIAGTGAVGSALVKLIEESSARIAARTGKVLRVEGVSNSKSFVIAGSTGNLPAANGAFFRAVREQAPRGSIFVDVTDSEDIWREYEGLLRNGINIVSSNRRALAVPFVEYAAMKAAAQENGVFLRYETTVGSALPMLESIAAGTNSSDEILSLEAVVSCTLNEILTSYDYSPASFAQIVRKAQNEGLTESDPRIDLSGREALRKLLILAREAGVPLEKEDVEITPVVGPEFFDIPLDEFYAKLESAEPEFKAREAEADAKGCHQRFVASLAKDPAGPHGYKASIGLRLVDENHPAYRITGTENAIIIRSAYHPYPLLIQGAGEGALLAASSVLNDILK
ncbi:MAG: aspartate kinase [Bacteroidales bacterium]|nr:aspartate kinase [Bacteroidales bacterium]